MARKAKRRGNNEGSITQRKDGLWQATMTVGRTPDGKLKRAYFYAKTRQEAAEKLAKAQHDKARGAFVQPHKQTLGEWLDTWLWEYKKPRVRHTTFDSYERITRGHLKPALGHIPLRDLRPEHLQHFYNEKVREGLAGRHIAYMHTLLHNALAQAEKNQLVARNVSTLVDRPRAEQKEMHTLTMAQVAGILFPALKEDRLYAAYVVLFTTGLRRGELLALRWKDVDLQKGVLHVRQTLVRVKNHDTGRTGLMFSEPKTAKARRSIPLPDMALEALKHHKAHQAAEKLLYGPDYDDNGLVFCNPDGKPMNPSNFGEHFGKALKRAGLPHIRLHDARHTFATWLLEQGESPRVAQEMLGHSSAKITLDIYSHVSPDMERKAASRLNAALVESGVL